MSSLWQAYLPHHVTQQLLQNPQASPIGYEARGTAVILFADVSGFTAISEALSVIGKQGAEELTHLLNSYFEPMIELIQTYGGIIAKFGGDAMTVLFPYTPENGHLVSHQAIQCALLMQEGMGAYAKLTTPMGQFALTMKAGLAAGPVFYSSVGDPQLRLEYIIAGQALDQCAEAEHQASKGQVILHQTVLNLAGESVQVTAVNDHFALVHTLSPPPQPLPCRLCHHSPQKSLKPSPFTFTLASLNACKRDKVLFSMNIAKSPFFLSALPALITMMIQRLVINYKHISML